MYTQYLMLTYVYTQYLILTYVYTQYLILTYVHTVSHVNICTDTVSHVNICTHTASHVNICIHTQYIILTYVYTHIWASLVPQVVKNPPAMWERPMFDPWVGKIPWRKKRLPTPVSWPGEFHGPYGRWGCKELDTTERLSLHFAHIHTHTYSLSLTHTHTSLLQAMMAVKTDGHRDQHFHWYFGHRITPHQQAA